MVIAHSATSWPWGAAHDPGKTRRTSSFATRTAAVALALLALTGCTSTAVASSNVDDEASAAAPATDVLELLGTLPVKGKSPMTGYAGNREVLFGAAWLDVDSNGCDTRNDILARDLDDVRTINGCKVVGGILHDAYTGESIPFEPGLVIQIDHRVSLGNAWATGAQQISHDDRVALANDPLNLLAVKGKANQQKSDGDYATWQPKQKSYSCEYVAAQVQVKAKYDLWVTPAEHDAMVATLNTCGASCSLLAPSPAPSTEPTTLAAEVPARDAGRRRGHLRHRAPRRLLRRAGRHGQEQHLRQGRRRRQRPLPLGTPDRRTRRWHDELRGPTPARHRRHIRTKDQAAPKVSLSADLASRTEPLRSNTQIMSAYFRVLGATASPLSDHADNPGPFIWGDDDEVPVHGETVAEAVSEPVLLLAPTSALGLTPAHLEQVRAFLAGLPRMEGA